LKSRLRQAMFGEEVLLKAVGSSADYARH
jgi:hypothetical protein